VILANGGYAIMDRLAEREGSAGPWPSIALDIAGIARGLGCPARRIDTHTALEGALDDVVPTLPRRREPLVLEVVVAPDPLIP
jgi:benzoylformate decarboxylase